MDIHRTEEEQVEAIKNWWKENGTSVVVGVAFGIAAIFGVRYWVDYQKAQAEQASALYAEVLANLPGNSQKSESLASQVAANYASTPYASLTALSLAKSKVEAKDYPGAQSYLQWVLDNGKDDGFKHVARIRLARILIQNKQNEQAEKLINGVSAAGFDSEYAEIRGDIFHSNAELTQAAEHYRLALSGLQASSLRYQFLQMKIDDLVIEK